MTTPPRGVDVLSAALPPILFGLIPMLLIALPLVLWGVHQIRLTGELDRDGIVTEATVERVWVTRPMMGPGDPAPQDVYWIEYRFAPAGGEAVTGQSTIPLSVYIELELRRNRGESPVTIPVQYLPADPSVNSPNAPRANRGGWLRLAAGLAIAAVASLLIVHGIRTGRHLRRLGAPWRST